MLKPISVLHQNYMYDQRGFDVSKYRIVVNQTSAFTPIFLPRFLDSTGFLVQNARALKSLSQYPTRKSC